jgi:asparagine synthase (glutamine-hydrolysing)
MTHPENGDILIFNGELYNYKSLRKELEGIGIHFVGNSDTEVLLHALSLWGVNALPRLQGMFALAFYNAQEHRLLLARDPLGIKPLYVGKLADGWVFASEVRAILASKLMPVRIDERGLASFLAYGSFQHPLTLYQGIQSFPPGCHQWFDPDGKVSECQAFWTWPKPDTERSLGTTLDEIRRTLEASVREHLVADVPVGVCLSSGLDSTIIAGLAASQSPQIKSFTVGFADQPDMSEWGEAAQTAKRFNLDHTEISITSTQARAAALAWLATMDLPSIDGLNTYVISEAIRQQGIKVALSGLGGDELFGGYSSFSDVPRLYRLFGLTTKLPLSLRLMLGKVVSYRKPESSRQKLHDILSTDGSLLALYLQRRRLLSNRQLLNLGVETASLGLTRHYLTPESLDSIDTADEQPIWTISQLESRFYQANTLLRDTDANSMAHGLEIRVPMLGQTLVNLMGTVPDAIRLPSSLANKSLLRQAFSPLLRPSLLNQAKMGFTLPIRHWMLGPLREDCEKSLARLKSTGILRGEGIDQIWSEFATAPESPMWSRALALSVLGFNLDKI